MHLSVTSGLQDEWWSKGEKGDRLLSAGRFSEEPWFTSLSGIVNVRNPHVVELHPAIWDLNGRSVLGAEAPPLTGMIF